MSSSGSDNSKLLELTIAPALTAFLKPIGETTGKEIASQIKSYIEEKRANKREKNLQQHLLIVAELAEKESKTETNEQDEMSSEQLGLFDEWTEAVQDVSPEESLLSSMWHKLLIDIMSGKSEIHYLIERLKTINSSEAKVMLKLSSGLNVATSENDYFQLKELQKKMLVNRTYSSELITGTVPLVLMIFTFYIMSSISTLEMKGSVLSYDAAVSAIMLGGAILTTAVGYLIIYLFRLVKRVYRGHGIGKWHLNWAGKELVSRQGKVDEI